MKRIFAIILSLVMVISLCACGSDEPIRGAQTDNNPIDAPTDESTIPLEMGDTSGLNYESSYIGIGCNLPEGWVFYTDEEIAALNGMTSDMVGEEYQQLIESSAVLHDMHATSTDGMSTNVVMEKVSVLDLLLLNLEGYIENVAPTLADAMKSMGFETYDYEITSVTIDGEEFVCMRGIGAVQDVVLYQYSIPVKCSGHLATITIGGDSQEALDEIVSYYYLVD